MANLIHDMQYVPCNSALLAQETLFFYSEEHYFVQRFLKSAQIVTNLNITTKKHVLGLCQSPNFSGKALHAFPQLLPPCKGPSLDTV